MVLVAKYKRISETDDEWTFIKEYDSLRILMENYEIKQKYLEQYRKWSACRINIDVNPNTWNGVECIYIMNAESLIYQKLKTRIRDWKIDQVL